MLDSGLQLFDEQTAVCLLVGLGACFIAGWVQFGCTGCGGVAGGCLGILYLFLAVILRFLGHGFACFTLVLGGEVWS